MRSVPVEWEIRPCLAYWHGQLPSRVVPRAVYKEIKPAPKHVGAGFLFMLARVPGPLGRNWHPACQATNETLALNTINGVEKHEK